MKYAYVATVTLFFTDRAFKGNTRPVSHAFGTMAEAYAWIGKKEEIISDFLNSAEISSLYPINLCEYYLEDYEIKRVPFN